MKEESESRNGCGRNESAPRVPTAQTEEEENEIEESEESVRPGFGSIEQEQRRRRAEENEEQARLAVCQSSVSGDEQHAGRKREETQDLVRTVESLGREHKRLLEQVEERRTRIGSQNLDHLPDVQARHPDGEDLVMPERSVDRQEDARRERSCHDRAQRELEAKRSWRSRFDGVS